METLINVAKFLTGRRKKDRLLSFVYLEALSIPDFRASLCVNNTIKKVTGTKVPRSTAR